MSYPRCDGDMASGSAVDSCHCHCCHDGPMWSVAPAVLPPPAETSSPLLLSTPLPPLTLAAPRIAVSALVSFHLLPSIMLTVKRACSPVTVCAA